MSIQLISMNSIKDQICAELPNNNHLLDSIINNFSINLRRKYLRVDFDYLLKNNIKSFDELSKLKNCLMVIRKYTTNLLQEPSLRQDQWKTIFFQNSIFQEYVILIKGSIQILKDLGYTEEKDDCITYPLLAQPNKANVQMILVDLLCIDLELIYLINRKHPFPELFSSYFQCPEMSNFQKYMESPEEIFVSCVYPGNLWGNENNEKIELIRDDITLFKNLRNTQKNIENRIRILLAEGNMTSYSIAKFALSIVEQLDEDQLFVRQVINLDDIVNMANSINIDTKNAVRLLQQECSICKDNYPPRLIETLCCSCKLCTCCINTYFEDKIINSLVCDLCCPACRLPSIKHNDELTDCYLSILNSRLKVIVKPDIYTKFEDLVIAWTLQKQLKHCPWACGYGFLLEDCIVEKYLICPKCKSKICKYCFDCCKDDHKCSIASTNTCPSCETLFILVRGGCLDTTCSLCKFQFCNNCLQPFKNKECKKYASCVKMGLHCHHPRDCLYYLRDKPVELLESFLEKNLITYKVKCVQEYDQCNIIIMNDSMQESICGKRNVEIHNSMCKTHYIEHLVALINNNRLDPISIYEVSELERWIKEEHLDLPDSSKNNYRKLLENIIVDKIPLRRKTQVATFPTMPTSFQNFTDMYNILNEEVSAPEFINPDNRLTPRGIITQVN